MFGFGSSSSSSSSSSSASSAEIEAPAPTRQQRQQCWSTRDAYFACLDKNKVYVPGDEVKKDDKGKEVQGGFCSEERVGYENACGKSWIDYFNKRRILELRRQATIHAAEQSGNQQAADAWRSVSGTSQNAK
ncbi:hypothetical protein CI109_102567 [Kwoniella shandongensis]|uniref:Uncharacterized protein n=1 Tax=Kwoniella shandongensis TaxID=1734106 RepID=A0A5M6BW98_9TREE|nr:uncharacterized protein CI109_005817 [Kwoniella shandongensis]KAA5525795.1 hypothetical protein CI109_005817 [Kwoniella shandongensis]